MTVQPATMEQTAEAPIFENRILIYTPTGKDARLISQVLAHVDIESEICPTAREMEAALAAGASALIIADECMSEVFLQALTLYVTAQPTWSDLPILILSIRGHQSSENRQRYRQLGNVTLLERPFQTVTLLSAVTSAKRARTRQFEMRELERRKDEFLAMLAHELRNPLAPISSAAELLSMPNLDRSRTSNAGKVILRQVKHMSGLIDDLLDASRVSRGQITLSTTRVDVNSAVATAVEQVQPLIDARRHRLTANLASKPALVLADSKRIIQIIANILNNSAKYTPDGGEIVLSLVVYDLEIELMVSDTGIGISPTVIPHIFELFSQGEGTPDRSQGGLGIGLALVKNLVHLHGGTVSAESRGVGYGSLFRILLPRIF